MGCIVIRKIAFDKEEDTILETFPIGGPNHLDWFKQNGYSYYHDKTTDFPNVSAKEEYIRFLSDKKDSSHNGRRAS